MTACEESNALVDGAACGKRILYAVACGVRCVWRAHGVLSARHVACAAWYDTFGCNIRVSCGSVQYECMGAVWVQCGCRVD